MNRKEKARRLDSFLHRIVSVRPLIAACDWDDTIEASAVNLMAFGNQRFGIRNGPTDLGTFSFEKSWGVDSERGGRAVLDYHREAGTAVTFVPGALRAIARMSASITLMIVSARSLEIIDVTHRSVGTHLPNCFAKVIHCDHPARNPSNFPYKIDVLKEEGADLIVDDSVTTALECGSAGMWMLLLDSPWNRSFPDKKYSTVIRVGNWGEILALLRRALR